MALLTNSADAIAPNVTDILLTNKENGRIGLTAGIDLDVGATSVSIFQLNLTPEQFKKVLDKGAMVHIKLGTLEAEVVTGAVISKVVKAEVVAEPDHNPISGGDTFGQGSNTVAPSLFPETVDNNPIASAEPEDVKPAPAPKPVAKPAVKPAPAKK